MSSTKKEIVPEEFDWIQLSADIQTHREEEFGERFWRKVKSNPFVPVGAFAATAALTYGLFSMARNDQKMSQLMMRARITAQGFCIAALIVGLLVANPLTPKNKDENKNLLPPKKKD